MDIIGFFHNEYGFLMGIFLSAFGIQLFYYLFFYIRVPFSKKKERVTVTPPVSIIICARNEEINLQKHLHSLLQQDYPDYEVIVVDDCSTDESLITLSEFKKMYTHLHYTHIEMNEKFSHGKKLAVAIGIKAAKHEWMLFTDADCKVTDNQWLRTMASQFSEQNSIILGYGAYQIRKSFLNNWLRFDTFFIGLQYLSAALAGIPYMGVGRNMAYRRSLFFGGKGFTSHIDLISGDDDLFVNEHARSSNTKVVLAPSSITFSEPETQWNGWFRQKSRHLTTGGRYRLSSKIYLGLEIISRLTFYTLFTVLLINNAYLPIIYYILITRMIIQIVIYYSAMKRLQEKYLLLSSLVYDVIMPIMHFVLFITNALKIKNKRI